MEKISKPILIFDGDCEFCSKLAMRWKYKAADRLDFAPYQNIGHKFPEISTEQFERTIYLIQSQDDVIKGAEAVYKVLYFSGKPYFFKLYKKFSCFAKISECFYNFVSRNRKYVSPLVKIFL